MSWIVAQSVISMVANLNHHLQPRQDEINCDSAGPWGRKEKERRIHGEGIKGAVLRCVASSVLNLTLRQKRSKLLATEPTQPSPPVPLAYRIIMQLFFASMLWMPYHAHKRFKRFFEEHAANVNMVEVAALVDANSDVSWDALLASSKPSSDLTALRSNWEDKCHKGRSAPEELRRLVWQHCIVFVKFRPSLWRPWELKH